MVIRVIPEATAKFVEPKGTLKFPINTWAPRGPLLAAMLPLLVALHTVVVFMAHENEASIGCVFTFSSHLQWISLRRHMVVGVYVCLVNEKPRRDELVSQSITWMKLATVFFFAGWNSGETGAWNFPRRCELNEITEATETDSLADSLTLLN